MEQEGQSRESVIESMGFADEKLDNSPKENDTIGTVEKPQVDLSQDMTTQELSDDLKKQYGIPGDFKSMSDLLKSYKELNSYRGKQGEELGSIKQQYAQLAQAYQGMQQKVNELGKPQEAPYDDNAFLQDLTTKPRDAIRREARELVQQEVNTLREQMSKMNDFIQKQNINSERLGFIQTKGLSEQDQSELAEIIRSDPDYYKSFPTTQHVLRAAYADMMEKRGFKQPEVKAPEQKKPAVIGSSITRPKSSGGEDKRESVLRSLGIPQ